MRRNLCFWVTHAFCKNAVCCGAWLVGMVHVAFCPDAGSWKLCRYFICKKPKDFMSHRIKVERAMVLVRANVLLCCIL